jgi:hypothetical protein
MTGESFVNVFGINTQLNYHDLRFTSDPEVHCGKILLTSITSLEDESCNIRKRQLFVCEVLLVEQTGENHRPVAGQ